MGNYQVKLVVEEIDDNGDILDTVSDEILGSFEDDVVDDMDGYNSDNFFNTVIRKSKEIGY